MKKLILGKQKGHEVAFDLELLIRTRLLIQANSGGGKSWAIRRIAEQAFGAVQVIVLDPEDEFASLREKHGYVLVGQGGETPADPRSAELVAKRLLELNASAVCALYELKKPERHRWVRLFVEALMDAPKALWHPVIIISDEAHVTCPEKGQGESEALSAMVDLATRGRKRGFCPIYATQRLGKLSKNAAAELLNVMIGQTFIDIDQHRAAESLGIPRKDERAFFAQMKVMDPGNFWCLGRALSRERILVKVGGVKTTHPEPGSSKHAAKVPPPPARIKHLLPKLADLPKEAEAKAKTESDLRKENQRLKIELARKPVSQKQAPVVPVQTKIQVKEKVIKIPALTKGEIKAIQKAVERMDKAREDFQWRVQSLETESRMLSSQLALLIERSEEALKKRKVVHEPNMVPRTGKPISSRPVNVTITKRERGQPRPVHTNGDEIVVTGGKRRILEVLAQFHPGSRTRSQLGQLSGYTPSGGTFSTYFNELRKTRLLKENFDNSVSITDEGLSVFGGDLPKPPESSQELIDMWRSKLNKGERKMFDALVDSYPNPMTKEELGEASGFTASGGTFGTYLGTLRRNGIARVEEENVVASETLFEMEG